MKIIGGRGIIMCDEWKNNFLSFKDWAMTNGYKEDLTIDRIDVNGNYEPDNCRWITNKEQQSNKRNNVIVEYNNEKMTLKQWSDRMKLDYKSVHYYYHYHKIPLELILDKAKKRIKR